MSYFTTTLHDAAEATGGGLWIDVRDFESVAIQFVGIGTPNGTITFEGSLFADKSNVRAVTLYADGDPTTPVTTATGAGLFVLPENHAYYWLRARISTYNSGEFSVVAARRSGRHRAEAPTAAAT